MKMMGMTEEQYRKYQTPTEVWKEETK